MTGDLLRHGSQWLAAQLAAHAASQVTYRRADTELVLSATFGRTEYEVEDDYGLRVGAEVTDFLILAADFIPTFGEPEPGDQIISDGVAYEVMALAGQGHWRWSDPYRTTMRIHVKQVGEE
ncbi:MAG: hypothetical protein ACP5HU_10380 [Phycisphaerae bacterium]